MRDILDNEIQVGDTVAYSLAIGRSAELAIYQVLEVFSEKIRVQKLYASYSLGYRFSFDREAKPSIIKFSERLLCITSLIESFGGVDKFIEYKKGGGGK